MSLGFDYLNAMLEDPFQARPWRAEGFTQDIGVHQRALALCTVRPAPGITPRQYIRQRKLEQVHACLSDASCPVRNVTELALDYGFLHCRFSDSYRQQFGELPPRRSSAARSVLSWARPCEREPAQFG